MGWFKDLWQILQAVATLTKEVERSQTETKELRRDVNDLTLTVIQLKNDLQKSRENIQRDLDEFNREIGQAKADIATNFELLTAKLEVKVANFERRLLSIPTEHTSPKSLKSGTEV